MMTDDHTIRFDVLGIPGAQAGMRAVPTARGIRAITTGTRTLADWRTAVTVAAHQQQKLHGTITQPIGLITVFRLPMPKSRPKTDRARGWNWRASTPDLDKLQRAIGDSLTAAALITDDRQIVAWSAAKIETTDWCGVTITITTPERIHTIN